MTLEALGAGFGAFLIAVFLDWCWARYTLALTARRAHAAAFWSTVLYLSGAALTLNVVAHPWLLAPAALGCYVGTWLALREKSGDAPSA